MAPGTANQDALLRLNFLLQAAALLTAAGDIPIVQTSAVAPKLPQSDSELSCHSDSIELGRFFIKTMREIASKLVIRMYIFCRFTHDPNQLS